MCQLVVLSCHCLDEPSPLSGSLLLPASSSLRPRPGSAFHLAHPTCPSRTAPSALSGLLPADRSSFPSTALAKATLLRSEMSH